MKRKKNLLIDKVVSYYAERAVVYDETAGYTDEAAEQLRAPIKQRYQKLFAGHDVFEIACGSGYWTKVVGEVAKSVLAIDINQAMLSQAQDRCRHLPHVTFQRADAFRLQEIPNQFTAAFGIWWWSHIPKTEIKTFLAALHSILVPGALVLFSDHLPYEGSRRKVDSDGNVIEHRSLPDGRTFEVVKNCPTETELMSAFRTWADQIEYVARPAEKSWTVIYRTRARESKDTGVMP